MRLRTKILLGGSGLLVVLLATVAVWIAIASRNIPPPDFSDLDYPFLHLQDETNAHTWFVAAGKAVVWGERERVVYDRLRTNGTVEAAEVDAVLATNAPALALLRRGLACTACQPPLVTNVKVLATVQVGPLTDVAKVLSLDCRWKSRNGDAVSALGDCLDLLRYGDLEVRQSTCLINCLISQFILGMGIATGRDLVASNRLDDVSLLSLDGALQNLDVGRTGMPNGLRGEFLFQSGITDDLCWGRISEAHPANATPTPWARWRIPRFLLKPNETRLFYAEGTREGIRNIPLTFKKMKSRDVEVAPGLKKGNRLHTLWQGNMVGKVLAASIYPAIDSAVKGRCRSECDRAGLRLLIACRRYERQNGRLPEKLDDLVPEFIEAVPKDPFDGQPLRYSREKRIVWAVGENLKDDGGSKMSTRDGRETTDRRKTLDYVIDIPALPTR